MWFSRPMTIGHHFEIAIEDEDKEYTPIRFVMGFGADLQGKDSHEALQRIQDAEIRLLENIRRCMQIRVDSDKKYAAALTQLAGQAQKVNADPSNEFAPLCSIFQVWDVVVRETQQLAALFSSSSEELSSKTLEKLTSLISEKKSARKHYSDERNRLEAEFAKLQEDLGKTKTEYHKSVDRLRLDKARYEDNYRKGKTATKLDDAKTKYLRSTVKLHKLHNDYVLGIQETHLHQDGYLSKNLPSFLDYHQNTQHILVEQCKDILLDYSRVTNMGLPQYQDIYNAIQDAVQEINPDEEYNKFIQEHRTETLIPLPFEFDEKLLDDYQGTLQLSQIACDDLTLETLKHRRVLLEDKLNQSKSYLSNTQAELSEMVQQLEAVRNKLIQEADDLTKNDYYVKRRAMEILRRNLVEQECEVAKLQALFDSLDGPLTELADKAPPPGLELPDMNGIDASRADVSTSSGSSASSGLSAIKGNLMKVLRKPGKDDNHLSKAGSRSHLPPGGTSYDAVQKNVNGSGEPKFQINHVNDDFVPKNLEDEEWFHGILPRDEVQRLLQNDGDFLVRESKNRKSNETQYVLSVFWMTAKHFIIQRCEGGWRFEGQIFPTMSELIHFQFMSGEPVTSKSQALLKTPILREEWELKNDDIELQQKIGNGNFGEVFKGLFRPKGMIVAVKTCKDTLKEEQRKTFMTEGRILKQYDHPNIVRFIGIATQRQPVMIIMEYCSGGALLSFLRRQGRSQAKRTLVMMCRDAASGMAYLEDKGCIHRDLAARNCLIASQNVVKISDFGMSREEEEYTVSEGMKQIPIKWTAPEALNFGKYTSLCDVWSYGILMWEVFSCGTTPYTGMSNSVARDQIESGYRMPAPEGTPDNVYQLMLKCWEYKPEMRPHFRDIFQELLKTLNSL